MSATQHYAECALSLPELARTSRGPAREAVLARALHMLARPSRRTPNGVDRITLRGSIVARLLFAACLCTALVPSAVARQRPTAGDTPPSLVEAKEAWDRTVAATYAGLLAMLKQREADAQAELAKAKNSIAHGVAQNLADRIARGRETLVTTGAWPPVLAGKSELADRLQAARDRVDEAYQAVIKLAIIADDAPRRQRLARGRAAFAANQALSASYGVDQIRALVQVGQGEDAWTLVGEGIHAPDAKTAQGTWAPLVFHNALPRGFLLKVDVSRVGGFGGLWVELLDSEGTPHKVPLPADLLEQSSSRARPGAKPEHHIRVVFDGKVASVELEGEDVWSSSDAAAGGAPIARIDEVSIGGGETRIALASFPSLRPLPVTGPPSDQDASQPAPPPADVQCAGAVVPDTECRKIAAPVRAALQAYEDATRRIAVDLLFALEKVPKESLNLSIPELEGLKQRVDEEAVRLRFRADVPQSVPFVTRDRLQREHVREREKLQQVLDDALKAAETAQSVQCLADLKDRKAVFASTMDLAPWWRDEEVQALVIAGTGLRNWTKYGTRWAPPASLNTDGTRTPFAFGGDMPPEFVFEVQLVLSQEAREGLNLAVSRESRDHWDVVLSRAQLEACMAEGKTSVSLRLTFTRSRLIVELDRERVWCEVIATEKPAEGEPTKSFVRISIVGDVDGAKFNVDALNLKAVRTSG